MPHVLTQQQIDAYNQTGYLVVESVLDEIGRAHV